MKQAINRRLVEPIVTLVTQGITPEKIALSVSIGIVLGVFPVLGSTSLLCAAAAVVFELNLPAIQLINWFVYPLQLLLIVPFMRAGGFMFGGGAVNLSPGQMLAMARTNLPHAISALWVATTHAIFVWLLVGPVLAFLLHKLLFRYILRVAVPRSPRPDTPNP